MTNHVYKGDLPDGLEALVVLVVNAAQTEAAVFGPDGAAPRMAKCGVIISSATMAPDGARALAAKADAAGLLYLDAPVSGGAVKARAGEMTVMGAGSEAAFAKAAPVFDAIANAVIDEGKPFSLSLKAVDPDGSVVDW